MSGDPTNVYDYFWQSGFKFSNEIITRYCLSVMSKPFVILTGISGTGKTKIAQLFARYFCQDDDAETQKRRIAFVSVRPDWTDSRGLLGYFNILDGHYYPSRVLELLLAARDDPHRPYFVILDEMNLARVEYYFSDFLSLLESRTADRPEGEPLRLHDRGVAETAKELIVPGELHIPANVFFTGTVNVDESTYMFSPKVLDRAQVIEFNEVDLSGRHPTPQQQRHGFVFLNADIRRHLQPWPPAALADYRKLEELFGNAENALVQLLERLEPYNLHFGYRVANEIGRFVALASDLLGVNFDIATAIDIEILQKILPKFHGTASKVEEPLKELKAFCENERYPLSTEKLDRMLKRLGAQDYTSFIE